MAKAAMSDTHSSGHLMFDGCEIYANVNAKILELYDGESRVLDVGCGTGDLAGELKRLNPEAVVYGIDLSRSAGQIATGVLDHFYCLDLDHQSLPDFDLRFDLIILGDVLEHLKRPDHLLRDLRQVLDHNGSMIISVPNIAHYRIRKQLLLGRFNYTDTGILDHSHLRFFTYSSLQRMIVGVGLKTVLRVYHCETPTLLHLKKGGGLFRFLERHFYRAVASQFVFKVRIEL